MGDGALQCGRPLVQTVRVSGGAEGAAWAMNHRSRGPQDTGPSPTPESTLPAPLGPLLPLLSPLVSWGPYPLAPAGLASRGHWQEMAGDKRRRPGVHFLLRPPGL